MLISGGMTHNTRVPTRAIAVLASTALLAGSTSIGITSSALASPSAADASEDTARLLLSADELAAQGSDPIDLSTLGTADSDQDDQELLVADPEETVVTIIELAPAQANNPEQVAEALEETLGQQAAAEGFDAPDVEIVQEYDTAFTGIAVEIPRWGQPAVSDAPGVRTTFIERRYEIPENMPVDPLSTSTYDWANGSSLAMTGADQALELGDGMLISIIDTGLETTHEAFVDNLDTSKVRYTKKQIDKLRKSLGQGKTATYVNNKVPFAYDYADSDNIVDPTGDTDMSHGTHVAGISAANGGEAIRGTAPNAQVMVQKVFSDTEEFASDSWILAALDDAVKIKPDVINMSLGSSNGYSRERDSLYGNIYEKLRKNGVIINASAGNSQHAAVRNTSGQDLPYVTDPDYGVLSSPSSYEPNLSIASINNALARSYLLSGDGLKVYYQSAAASGTGAVTPFSELAEGTYKYVDAGIGTPEDTAAAAATLEPGEAENTIFLIRRGSITFQAKVEAAATYNPAAVLIMDNVESADLLTPSLDASDIPTAMISKSHGDELLASTTKTLTVDSDQLEAPSEEFRASAFSSMGVTPDLQLKPDVAAPGGNIYSAVPGNDYGWKSGTSMAAPQTAGILAILKQHILNNPATYGKKNSVQAGELAMQIMMNTARPLINPDSSEKTLYTPRKQGAGIANVPAAQRTPVYLTVKGATDKARPSASMGESDKGNFSFSFTAHNLTRERQQYTLDATALSDAISGGFFQDESVDWTGQGIDVSFKGSRVSGDKLTVPARGSATVKVTVSAKKAFKDAVKPAVNGTYVEGFVQLASDTAPTLSLPYLGFYGDWSDAPVFDADLVTEDFHIAGTMLYNTSLSTVLGVNPLDPNGTSAALSEPAATIKPERYVFSPLLVEGKPNEFQTYTGLLRNTDKLEYSLVQRSTGKSVAKYKFDQVAKSFYFANLGYILYAEDYLDNQPLFNGYDSRGRELKPGAYTLTQIARTSKPTSAIQRKETPLTFDAVGPKVEGVESTGEGADAALSVTVSDDTYLSAVSFHESETTGYFQRVLTTDTPFTTVKKRHVYEVTVPLSDIESSWDTMEQRLGTDRALPDSVTLYAWDYGLNRTAGLSVDLTGVEVTRPAD